MHPEVAALIADGSPVPGNVGLAADRLATRIAQIHASYHDRIALELTRRAAAARPTISLLSTLSPRLFAVNYAPGLYDASNTGFAKALLAALRTRPDFIIDDNESYRMDTADYSVPRHAYRRGLPNAEIEIRQDLLADPAGIALWRETLHFACETALAAFIHKGFSPSLTLWGPTPKSRRVTGGEGVTIPCPPMG